MSHLLSCSRSVGHCSLAAPNAVPAMPRPQLAKRSERLVMQAAGATAIAPPAPATPQVSTAPLNTDLGNLSAAYSRQMKDAMGWGDRPYDYSYERGLYYHEIIPNLFCGSQPRHKDDVQELHQDLGVTAILSLQQDKDMQHWGVNPEEIRNHCQHLGINLMRRPVKDFDPNSLRKTLPSAVSALHEEISAGGKVYVHCTAGLGRAPAVVIAYLYWFRGLPLHQAYDFLTSIRPCGPKKEAIRGATFDLMSGQPMDNFTGAPGDAFTNMPDVDRYALQWRVIRS